MWTASSMSGEREGSPRKAIGVLVVGHDAAVDASGSPDRQVRCGWALLSQRLYDHVPRIRVEFEERREETAGKAAAQV
jgi:hypothetical protein